MAAGLQGADTPLVERFDVAMLDLDGVVYVGQDAVPGAPDALARAREHGMALAFVTNNAARPPSAVAEHLTELGIEAQSSEVITSAQAAARWLGERLPRGSRVLVLGTTGLLEALRERGLEPVADASGEVAAVVQGYSPDMNWRLLAEGAVAIRRGATWVATNVDPTVPSPRGPLPGNGSLVDALRPATGQAPVVTGKPDPTMHRETLIRTGAQRPVVVGDRLDTDIEGANAVGCPSLLVFSGVTGLSDVLAATPLQRPTYLAADVAGLLEPHPEVEVEGSSASCGRWRAVRDASTIEISASGARAAGARTVAGDDGPDGGAGNGPSDSDWTLAGRLDDDALDAIRAACGAAWSDVTPESGGSESGDPGSGAARSGGEGPESPDSGGPLRLRAADGDGEAAALLERLGVPSD